LARTHHDLPKRVQVRGRLGGEDFEREVPVKNLKTVASAFVPRLWAAAYVRRLLGAASGPDAERGRIAALGIDYGLMTPFTSILALESEAAYRRMGIPRRRSELRGVRLTTLDRRGEIELNAVLHPAAPVAFGCDKRSPEGTAVAAAEPMEQKPAEVEGNLATPDDRQSGQGKLGKSERGRGDMTAVPEMEMAQEPMAGEDAPRAASPAPMRAKRKANKPVSRGGRAGGMADEGRFAGGKGDKDDDSLGDKEVDEVVNLPSVRHQGRQLTVVLGTCSADARRPLSQRALVWRKRLATVQNAGELVARYQAAMRACELQDWRAERTFLELLQRRIDSEGTARLVLSTLASRPEVQRFVARLVLRRAVDERLVAAVEEVLFGAAVRWADVDLELSAIEDVDERIATLQKHMARAPQDPNGVIRLVELLATAGRGDEALSVGRRLRARGLMTLKIARQLGDVLARAGLDEEAIRTYSEIVEFDPKSIASRRLLGDIYLSRGWYDPAYRQYLTIAEADASDPLGWLRLASAAAGAGRVDEALRIDRKVATAQGRPGPNDPRRWARLWSAARLAQLLVKPPEGAPPEALERKLKELSLFRGEGTLVLLTWADLTADVVLVTRAQDGEALVEVAVGEATDAAVAGLSANLLARADLGKIELWARLRSVPRSEPLTLVRHDIHWDGKKLTAKVSEVQLPAGETAAKL